MIQYQRIQRRDLEGIQSIVDDIANKIKQLTNQYVDENIAIFHWKVLWRR